MRISKAFESALSRPIQKGWETDITDLHRLNKPKLQIYSPEAMPVFNGILTNDMRSI